MEKSPDKNRGQDKSVEKIQSLRQKIDKTDEKIAELLSQRLQLCREIGKEKKENSISVTDCAREAAVIQNAVNSGRQKDKKAIENIYSAIISECKKVQ